jgi:staphylococcal nuclease domain-containing protein 1
MAAEAQAQKQQKGVFAKKDIPVHRINDLTSSNESSRIKHQYLPSWQRALRTEAVVEFVASGSRFRLFIPKESCLVTFLLGGITCPRSSRPGMDGKEGTAGDPFGDDAYNFVKDRILQRDISIHVDTVDKAGTAIIGWLWLENNVNLSVALVEEGLATVHFTAEKSEHYRALKGAEDQAKAQKKNIWASWVEPVAEEPKAQDGDDDVIETFEEKAPVERKMKLEKIVVTEVTSDFHFYAQHTDSGPKLEQLMTKLRQDFKASPPVSGSYTPKRDDLCAAKFSEDEEWYRARVLKVDKNQATIKYIDYGNTEVSN